MDHRSFIRAIVESDVEGWTRVGHPVFPYVLGPITQGNKLVDLHYDHYHNLFCLKSDLSISMAYGLTCNDNFQEDWANGFPDAKAYSSYVDCRYNGVIVFRTAVVGVDGGRAILPIPKPGTVDVSRTRARFARLIHHLTGHGGYSWEEYFQRAGLREIDETWPESDDD